MRVALLACLLACWVPPASAADADAPGALIRADAIARPPAGTQAWRITYWTRTASDAPRAVTGVVVAPSEASAGKPREVIAWTHGTWGVAHACAPSLSPHFFDVTPGIARAVHAGRVVVAPDYPGLGSDGVHPYLVGEDTARSVLDAVRAAAHIPGTAAGTRFAVWGESQGGHAALWTGQSAQRYAPELVLVGVAAAAPPTDLAANFRDASDPSAKAFLTALAAASWSQHYGLPLQLGRARTPALIEALAKGCISLRTRLKFSTLLGILTLRRDLRQLDFGTTRPWADYVARNSVAPALPVPLLIAQTRADPLVAPGVTRHFARLACAAGVHVHWLDLPGGDHTTTARQSATATLAWLADRFADHPAPDDCPRL